MSSRLFAASLAVLAGAAAASAQTIIVSPNSRATVEGSTSSAAPFADPDCSRYQQVYGQGSLSSLVGKSITHIAFRLDGTLGPYAGGFVYPQLHITMATSNFPPDQLSTDMQTNVGPNARVVYNGAYTLPALGASPTPHPFDMVIQLQTPFPYTGGALLIDVSGPIGPSSPFTLDAESVAGDAISRVYSNLAAQVTADTKGLITRITASGPCYPNCDGSTEPPLLNINDFLCFQQRFSAGDTWANCDESTAAPVLNINDFQCFLNRYSAGCV
jgi:hypothetical protein